MTDKKPEPIGDPEWYEEQFSGMSEDDRRGYGWLAIGAALAIIGALSAIGLLFVLAASGLEWVI